MKTKIYRVQGKFIMGNSFKPFTRELKAIGEEDIKEKYTQNSVANTTLYATRYTSKKLMK